MSYTYKTSRQTLADSLTLAMEALAAASSAANQMNNTGEKAEVLAEIGNGYARVAQAAAESLDEVA